MFVRPACRAGAAAALACLIPLLAPAHRANAAAPPKATKTPAPAAAALVGKVIPSLPVVTTLPTEERAAGETFDICAVKGWKVVYFWSPECPCVRACQKLSLFPLSRVYQDRGVQFFAIAANATNIRKLRGANGKEQVVLVTPNGLGMSPPYPIVIDPDRRVADTLKATNTPQAFLLDPENRVVFCGNPDDSEEILEKTGQAEQKSRDYLEDALTDALAGKAVRLPVSPVKGCDIMRTDLWATGPAAGAK